MSDDAVQNASGVIRFEVVVTRQMEEKRITKKWLQQYQGPPLPGQPQYDYETVDDVVVARTEVFRQVFEDGFDLPGLVRAINEPPQGKVFPQPIDCTGSAFVVPGGAYRRAQDGVYHVLGCRHDYIPGKVQL